jgi:hypothetical protein
MSVSTHDLALACCEYGAIQLPAELEVLLGLVQDREPKTVLEIGVAQAGTWFGWCQVAADDALLVGVDLPAGHTMREGTLDELGVVDDRQTFVGCAPDRDASPEERMRQAVKPGQTYKAIWGDSTSQACFVECTIALDALSDDIVPRLEPCVDFLFIDGGHEAATVRSDWLMYAPLVRDGGLVAFHDIAETRWNLGVPPLWRELKSLPGSVEIIGETAAGTSTPFGIGVLEMSSEVRARIAG